MHVVIVINLFIIHYLLRIDYATPVVVYNKKKVYGLHSSRVITLYYRQKRDA